MNSKHHVSAGHRALDVLSKLEPLPDNGPEMQKILAAELTKAGFNVRQEAFITKPWASTRGRINILATYGGGQAAIEIDRRNPRASSIGKLRAVDAFRIVVVRRGQVPTPYGIDAVVSVEVRT